MKTFIIEYLSNKYEEKKTKIRARSITKALKKFEKGYNYVNITDCIEESVKKRLYNF
jgi:hypothetical protein